MKTEKHKPDAWTMDVHEPTVCPITGKLQIVFEVWLESRDKLDMVEVRLEDCSKDLDRAEIKFVVEKNVIGAASSTAIIESSGALAVKQGYPPLN